MLRKPDSRWGDNILATFTDDVLANEVCEILNAKTNLASAPSVVADVMRSLPSGEETWEAAEKHNMNHIWTNFISAFVAGANWMRAKVEQ